MIDKSFWKNKRVLITGHTGFKGAWLCKVLSVLGADIIGYALPPNTEPNLYELAKINDDVTSIYGDIRDLNRLIKCVEENRPEIVFHLAAQPIVRESYKNPVYTYEVNVLGTVNLFESLRQCNSVRSVVNVTTDKVYKNNEWAWGYRESDTLDGYDPYANSKSCSELVTNTYKRAFLNDIAISTCRAGNVIGGGDFAVDRIIPDCVRAATNGEEIIIRNPHSVRPYQHVLEPIFAYLLVAQKQYQDPQTYEGRYNIGPDSRDTINTATLVNIFCQAWGEGVTWKVAEQHDMPHEANLLRLDCAKIKSIMGWNVKWNIEEAVKRTVEWSKKYARNEEVSDVMEEQINDYLEV